MTKIYGGLAQQPVSLQAATSFASSVDDGDDTSDMSDTGTIVTADLGPDDRSLSAHSSSLHADDFRLRSLQAGASNAWPSPLGAQDATSDGPPSHTAGGPTQPPPPTRQEAGSTAVMQAKARRSPRPPPGPPGSASASTSATKAKKTPRPPSMPPPRATPKFGSAGKGGGGGGGSNSRPSSAGGGDHHRRRSAPPRPPSANSLSTTSRKFVGSSRRKRAPRPPPPAGSAPRRRAPPPQRPLSVGRVRPSVCACEHTQYVMNAEPSALAQGRFCLPRFLRLVLYPGLIRRWCTVCLFVCLFV